MNFFKKLLSPLKLELNLFSKFSNSNRTTSIHILNADKGLNLPLKILYWFLNTLNNFFPNYKIDKDLEIRNFKVFNLEKNWSKLYITNSPGRKLADLFWIDLPWDLIKAELKEINILDVGCGSGYRAANFIKFSNNNINQYIGLDIKAHSNWINLKEQYPFLQFHTFDGNFSVELIPPNTNFFRTTAALEHFEADLVFFKHLRDYIYSSRQNTIQIHSFPARVSLYIHHFHGVRQYTPRTVSKITRLFKNFSYAILFKLGGKYCNYIHYKYITEPYRKKLGDIRSKKIQEYNRLTYNAIKKDMKDQQNSPSGYILLIHSHWKGNTELTKKLLYQD